MNNLYLIGMRGSGKTTIAQQLSEILNRHWIDMDQEIKNEAGKDITEIVTTEGWEAFRKREQKAVDKMCELKDTVISTGGGVLMFYDNADKLQKSGTFILLTAHPETLFERLSQKEGDRPSIKGLALQQELDDLWEERKEVYHRYADITIETDGKTPKEIVTRILAMLP